MCHRVLGYSWQSFHRTPRDFFVVCCCRGSSDSAAVACSRSSRCVVGIHWPAGGVPAASNEGRGGVRASPSPGLGQPGLPGQARPGPGENERQTKADRLEPRQLTEPRPDRPPAGPVGGAGSGATGVRCLAGPPTPSQLQWLQSSRSLRGEHYCRCAALRRPAASPPRPSPRGCTAPRSTSSCATTPAGRLTALPSPTPSWARTCPRACSQIIIITAVSAAPPPFFRCDRVRRCNVTAGLFFRRSAVTPWSRLGSPRPTAKKSAPVTGTFSRPPPRPGRWLSLARRPGRWAHEATSTSVPFCRGDEFVNR